MRYPFGVVEAEDRRTASNRGKPSMSRFATRTVSAAALALLVACGEAPPSETSGTSPTEAAPGPGLQPISFTGVAEPATGRLQIFMGPQAAIGRITEDADGNAGTVTTGTAQVYGANVTFASGGVGYPAGCNTGAAYAMIANVDVRSGFTEQLRNVYARMTSMSSGPSFCTTASAGGFGASLNPNVGLYLYQPLNSGGSPSAINRSLQWAMNLPDNSPYWFTGELWAEVIPAPPANVLPADDVTYHTGGTSRYRVNFSWTNDPLANGANPEGFAVARPTGGGASISILRCGTSSAPFNAANCTTTILSPTRQSGQSYSRRLNAGSWYQWSLRSAFDLPGGGTTWVLGSTVITRHFAVVNP
jgi:hypothetical protein